MCYGGGAQEEGAQSSAKPFAVIQASSVANQVSTADELLGCRKTSVLLLVYACFSSSSSPFPGFWFALQGAGDEEQIGNRLHPVNRPTVDCSDTYGK